MPDPATLSIKHAAELEDVHPNTVRNWIGKGMPVVRQGRPGGPATLVDPEVVQEWLAARGGDVQERMVRELARALPQRMAKAAEEVCKNAEGPLKDAAYRIMPGAWLLMAHAVTDYLRQQYGVDIPDITEQPPEIRRMVAAAEKRK